MSGFIVVRDADNHEARFQCNWHVNDATVHTENITSWQNFDLFFKQASGSGELTWLTKTENVRLFFELGPNENPEIDAGAFGSPEAFRFILDCFSAARHVDGSIARLVVPQSQGYIVRSDILSQRLLDCSVVKKVASFATPQQYFDGQPVHHDGIQLLPSAFLASVGAMLLSPLESTRFQTVESLLSFLDLELHNRLSFTWLSTEPPSRKTLALVGGGLRSPDDGGTGESIYLAAEALNIEMVVLDSPNHWLTDTRYRHWYKALIPFETPAHPDAGYADRLVEAVRSYPGQIHGVIALLDLYKVAVAKAALQLGLCTEPPSAYEIATNKFKTSVFEGHHAFQASSIEQAVSIVRENKLDFPLIIKPCNGFLSEGVFKVESLSELEDGIHGINTDRHGLDFVIEKYCDGPEVDANFVLCEGELLFFEVSDDFPKSADTTDQGSSKNFIELANVLPSKLPQSELDILRDSLHQSLLRMGLKNGFYHLEARVENSSMEYTTQSGILDLTERSIPAKGGPSAWLIEVNPRPPGVQVSEGLRHSYGVDYFGLSLLFGLNDTHRIRQLSSPFLQGPQYWCEMVFIPVNKGGIFVSGDVCAELFVRRPDLVEYVSKCFCFYHKGDKVPDPGAGVYSWVAYFIVFSRESRAHLLETAECIRQEVKYSIV
ncbi:hypothetical protein TMatcc_007498 [Talaromyces marneffei ATCC 18224]|uniref:ATP-grasp domain-containing protein n=1 Tax=Talaromyces marneffei (strain ATCC 18224 / CBS 334.59 / QM 7333) TaxID=441960 RepID=B6QG21_TALMQ|nr:conserved hypothetical protein [Talaromyces marneffei ATCC 18224]KAE8553083.1 hypothetical protein EYB25_004462 [Talaromyces marneffei]